MKYGSIDADALIHLKSNKIFDFFKRVFDLIGAFIGFIVAVPVVILFSILIRLETPGRAIYSQKRLGKNGKEFTIYKLRSMYQDAESSGAQWADKDDSRITKIGKFIRLTRIDELPQLLNVLIGDMSIVGPRPERAIFVEEFTKETPLFAKRMLVKPGLTGWAQVNGGYDLTPEMKLVFDLYYIENRGLKLDIIILLKTVKVIITGQGAR